MTIAAPSPLTARQKEILNFIHQHITEKHYSPTDREIAKAFGFSGPNGARCHLLALRKKGRVVWDEGLSRTLRVTGSVDE